MRHPAAPQAPQAPQTSRLPRPAVGTFADPCSRPQRTIAGAFFRAARAAVLAGNRAGSKANPAAPHRSALETGLCDVFFRENQRFVVVDLAVLPDGVASRLARGERHPGFDVELTGKLQVRHVRCEIAELFGAPEREGVFGSVLEVGFARRRQSEPSTEP